MAAFLTHFISFNFVFNYIKLFCVLFTLVRNAMDYIKRIKQKTIQNYTFRFLIYQQDLCWSVATLPVMKQITRPHSPTRPPAPSVTAVTPEQHPDWSLQNHARAPRTLQIRAAPPLCRSAQVVEEVVWRLKREVQTSAVMVEQFVGTWKLTGSENFDDYMRAIGTNPRFLFGVFVSKRACSQWGRDISISVLTCTC